MGADWGVGGLASSSESVLSRNVKTCNKMSSFYSSPGTCICNYEETSKGIEIIEKDDKILELAIHYVQNGRHTPEQGQEACSLKESYNIDV